MRLDQTGDLKVPADSPETSVIAGIESPKKFLTHIRELDGVRGIAALAVLFHHVCAVSFPLSGWQSGIRLIGAISEYGYAGVDLFFVLSGFLITSLLIEDRGNPRYYQDFYWKRALRILPLYALCLLVMFLFYPHSGSAVLLAAFFVANFARLFHVAMDGPFWTLAIEEQFYLIWPTIVRKRAIETVSRFAVWIWATVLVLRFIAACFGKHDYIFTFFHSDGLAMGAWLACRFERRNRLALTAAMKPVFWWGTLLPAAICIMIFPHMMTGSLIRVAFGAAFLQTAVGLLCGALVAFLLANRGKGYLAFFRSRILIFFGAISYAFYMFHSFVLHSYDALRGPMQTGDLAAYWIRFAVILGVTVVLCLLSRYLVERPAASLRKYVLHPRRTEN